MQPDDVLLGENQLALLADVQEVVTIGLRSHARIATPISFAGDGKTIALIDMHCGKLSHALGKFDAAISCRGEYFLAPIDQHVRSDEHTSELQSLMRISYAVFCLNKNITHTNI